MAMKMNHIGLVVKDVDETVKTYQDMFGFEVVSTMEMRGGEAKAVTMSCGDITLEFFQPLQDTGQFADFLRETGGGLHHVSFATDDIEADFTKLKAQGRKLQSEEPMTTPFARIGFVVAGDEGVLIELVERNK
jgi:methylmalonyl-CoA/ethylmalonyl-CoA epimerase